MKNLKKILLSLMVLFLAFAFIGCPAEPDPVTPVTPEPETPVVTNNFKGNVFVAEFSLGSYSDYWGYIEFLDDTNGKMGQAGYDEGKPIPITEQPFTYSVTDDVATIKATMDGMQFTVTTSKLTDGRFTFSTEGVDTVTGETYSVLVTCTKGDKSLFDVWTVVYEEQDDLMEDFFYGFEDYVKVLVEEDDYNLDTANKKIVLTENGYKKCCQPWTILQGEDRYEKEDYIESMLMFNMIGLKETTDYTIDIETLTITVTDTGMEKIQDAMWTISYPAEDFEIKQLEFMLLAYYESFGLVDGDYTKNDETKTITLTESGWEKVEAVMGGGSESEEWTVLNPAGDFLETFDSLEAANEYATENGLVPDVDYTMDFDAQIIRLTYAGLNKLFGEESTIYKTFYNGHELDRTFSDLEDFKSFASVVVELTEGTDYDIDEENRQIILTESGFGKMQGRTLVVKYNDVKIPDYEFYSWKELEIFATENNLLQGTDYTIDDVNWVITLTDAGAEKVGMGGVSEEWTVEDPEGNTLETFESLEAAGAFASSIGLEEYDDYTVNSETRTITLTDAGAEKVKAAMGGDTEGGDSSEVYYYMYNGDFCGGNTLEDFQYEVELYGLVEGTDYNIDHGNKYIIFTADGYAKLG